MALLSAVNLKRQQLSTGVNLKQFLKATRGAKKPKVPIIYDSKKGHI